MQLPTDKNTKNRLFAFLEKAGLNGMGIKPHTCRDRLITGCWGEPCGADLVRITFDKQSHIDLWFAEDVLWDLSAKDIKEAAHAVAVFLLRDTDIETPVPVKKASREEPGEEEIQIRKAASIAENKGQDERDFGTGVTNQRISDRLRLVEEAVQTGCAQESGLFLACGHSAEGGLGDEDVPGTVSGIVLAFRARVQVSSVVLHFRAKGLRPGTFLLLASRGNDLPGGCSVNNRGGDAGETRSGCKESDGGGPESARSRIGTNPEQITGAGSLGERPGVSLWVTNESVPLVQGMRNQWAEADAADDDATDGVGGCPARDLEDRRETNFENRWPAITLRVVPSSRAPLPAICCGVCGSSWETDCFGRGYRTYHLAVANHASLVWYIQRRFSDFLALHRDLSEGDGEDEWIPKGRLPKPPSRTFGLMKFFPQKMEKFRRNQLEAYMQELLTIPEALTKRSVLSFLGLLSTSSHDLMYPPNTRHETGPGEDHPLPRTPPSIRRPSLTSPLSSPTSSQSVVDPDGNTSEGSRLPLLMPMSTVGVKDTPTYSGGVFSDAPCAEARKETQRVDERRCFESGDRSRRQNGAIEDDHVKESGDGGNVEPLGSREGGEPRNVERVSTLELAVRGGDIFLFRCRGLLSRFQQWVLRSEWDHVGVVVSGGAGRPLELLESTPKGVQRNPLVDRVREYQEGGFAFKVAFRRLKFPRRTEASSRLDAFARQAEGKGYGVVFPFPGLCQSEEHIGPETPPALITPSDTPQSRRIIPPEQEDASSTTPPNCQKVDSRQLPQSYLCSQLVGAALLEMGLVREEVGGTVGPWSWLLPAAFGEGGAVEKGLAEGVTLGEEIFVDGQELEVASAVLLDAEVS